jgi:hypothetical protein
VSDVFDPRDMETIRASGREIREALKAYRGSDGGWRLSKRVRRTARMARKRRRGWA